MCNLFFRVGRIIMGYTLSTQYMLKYFISYQRSSSEYNGNYSLETHLLLMKEVANEKNSFSYLWAHINIMWMHTYLELRAMQRFEFRRKHLREINFIWREGRRWRLILNDKKCKAQFKNLTRDVCNISIECYIAA